MCVTLRQEVKPSTLPFMEEKSCSMFQQSCLTQTETRSKSVPCIFHSLSLMIIHRTLSPRFMTPFLENTFLE